VRRGWQLTALAQRQADEGVDERRHHRGADQAGGGRGFHMPGLDRDRRDRDDQRQLGGAVEGQRRAVAGAEDATVEQ
jgi:hypothetical protein